jgi:trimeric autotransporter adhesin
MKNTNYFLVAVISLIFASSILFSQGVVISPNESATPDPSAMLDVQSSEKGFLPPRMTTAERNGIVAPAEGLVVYDTDEDALFLFSGTEWEPLVSGSGSRWEANGDDIFRNTGNVGIGTNNPDYPLHLETAGEFTIFGTNLNASGTSYTVVGINHSTSGRGVYGYSNASTGNTVGVYAVSASNSGRGLIGWASATEGTTYGVYGLTYSTSGRGVYGSATATTGATYGVYGMNSSTSGYGVTGHASASSGANYGVYGSSSSTAGHGVYGMAAASSGTTHGVYGFVSSPDGYAGFFTGIAGSKNYFHQSVGIGELNPNEKLEVVGNIHVSGGNRTIFNRSNNSLAFGTNNTERMRITSGGSVGIGTVSPGAHLHVARTSSTSIPQLRLHNSSETGFVRFRLTNQAHEPYWDIAAGGTSNLLDFFQSGGAGSLLTLRGDNLGVGVRTTNPSFTLHVNGDAGKPGGGSWSSASDARLKSNIQDLQGSLENLLKLRGVTFLYNDPEAINELPGERIGMIAQEVAEVFPDWVNEANDGYLRLTYRGFEALVVEALRELKEEKDAEIAKLRLENEKLRVEKDSENAELSSRLQSLESRLDLLIQQGEVVYSQSN